MEEGRPVKITLDRAKRWYREGGELRSIALSLYSLKELDPQPDFEDVLLGKTPENVVTTSVIVPRKMNSGKDGQEYMQVYSLLVRIAKKCNKGWARTSANKGYFLVKNHRYIGPGTRFEKPYKVCSHSNLKIPGVVYFKEEKDCRAAGNFLAEKGFLKVIW